MRYNFSLINHAVIFAVFEARICFDIATLSIIVSVRKQTWIQEQNEDNRVSEEEHGTWTDGGDWEWEWEYSLEKLGEMEGERQMSGEFWEYDEEENAELDEPEESRDVFEYMELHGHVGLSESKVDRMNPFFGFVLGDWFWCNFWVFHRWIWMIIWE